jgi:hypothetical protein
MAWQAPGTVFGPQLPAGVRNAAEHAVPLKASEPRRSGSDAGALARFPSISVTAGPLPSRQRMPGNGCLNRSLRPKRSPGKGLLRLLGESCHRPEGKPIRARPRRSALVGSEERRRFAPLHVPATAAVQINAAECAACGDGGGCRCRPGSATCRPLAVFRAGLGNIAIQMDSFCRNASERNRYIR